MKILIVDDDGFSRSVLSEMLKTFGQCDQAADGYQAVDAYMKAALEGAQYDLICLDIIMPGMDGLQVLRHIRSIESENGISFPDSVRVIMVSSMSDLEHIMMSFDSRCEAYMIKPFDPQQLIDQLAFLGFKV
ncbi:MAG: response regulator [Desulfuromonadaceae bacterium]|nr:response regulator [Desulfuromonadaceae bacterium]MDD2853986.1 response regulator [Desulfuromonadaceae bacterium]